MTQIIHRYYRTMDEVAAALLPGGVTSRQIRVREHPSGGGIEIDVSAGDLDHANSVQQRPSSEDREPEADKPQTEEQKKPAAKGGENAKKASMLCQDRRFWTFMDVSSQEGAIDELRAACKIQSRVELDENPEAAEAFRRIRIDFENWCKE